MQKWENMYYLRSKWLWSLIIMGIFGIGPNGILPRHGQHVRIHRRGRGRVPPRFWTTQMSPPPLLNPKYHTSLLHYPYQVIILYVRNFTSELDAACSYVTWRSRRGFGLTTCGNTGLPQHVKPSPLRDRHPPAWAASVSLSALVLAIETPLTETSDDLLPVPMCCCCACVNCQL